jgi:hypothetical protein
MLKEFLIPREELCCFNQQDTGICVGLLMIRVFHGKRASWNYFYQGLSAVALLYICIICA